MIGSFDVALAGRIRAALDRLDEHLAALTEAGAPVLVVIDGALAGAGIGERAATAIERGGFRATWFSDWSGERR